MPLTRPLAAAAVAVALTLTAACGSSEPDPDASPSPTTPSPTQTPTQAPPSTPTPAGQTVEITFSHGDVEPIGKKVELKRGEKLTLAITAEAAGELHVHSTPEQTIEFPAGTSTHVVSLDRPGVYEVESHHPAKLVLSLEVR